MQKQKKNQGRYRLGASDLPPPRLLSSTGTRTGNTKTKIAANTPPAHPSIHPSIHPPGPYARGTGSRRCQKGKTETRNPEILSRNANGRTRNKTFSQGRNTVRQPDRKMQRKWPLDGKRKKEMGYLMASFKVVVLSDKLGEAQVSSPSTCARQRRGPCRGPPRTSGR